MKGHDLSWLRQHPVNMFYSSDRISSESGLTSSAGSQGLILVLDQPVLGVLCRFVPLQPSGSSLRP